MDVLADVRSVTRLGATVIAQTELVPPWGLEVESVCDESRAGAPLLDDLRSAGGSYNVIAAAAAKDLLHVDLAVSFAGTYSKTVVVRPSPIGPSDLEPHFGQLR